jgi:membrane-bound lytic murein transglycosylase A
MLKIMPRFLLSLSFLLLLSACAATPTGDTDNLPLVLKPAAFSDLTGWASDDHAQSLSAFAKSCTRILKQAPEKTFGAAPVGGTYGDWQPACRALAATPPTDARIFFETWFSPYQALMGGDLSEGLFTGYYEASLHGSLTRHDQFQTPLLKKPADLVMVDLGEFRDELKGQRIAGRVVGDKLKPYEDRAAIEAGKLANAEPLVWVDDPVDAFFLHVQGSGVVDLAEGGTLRVGYDGQNGHVYTAIGRELIRRGELKKENTSMQTIRAWMKQHPNEATDLMNANKSYVFFRKLDNTAEGPPGGENVALTPERSIAIDRTKIPYGVPLWIDVAPPTEPMPRLQRLMIAQDTGGAIRGAVRGDVFWGHGQRAEDVAGVMKSKGKMWLLLPKSGNER